MSLRLAWALRFRDFGVALVVGLSWALVSPATSLSKVFYAKDEALKLAFPDADQVEMRTFFLNDSERRRAEKLARTRIESKLFTFYTGKKAGSIVGYAAIDTHIVRTLPETFMVVLSPEADIRMTVILAFHEPPEYLPSERWLEQFRGRELSPELWIGRDIAGIAGSTLSAQAMAQGIRKILALFQILVKEKK